MWGLQKIVVLNNETILRPIILVWILACFGKTATIIVYQRPPYSLQILFYLASVVGIAIIWTLMDRMLKGCGLEQDALPSLGALVGGVIGLPLTEILAAVLGSIF